MLEQIYENYTSEDLKVWSILFERQIENLPNKASSDYLKSLYQMREVLNANKLPSFKEINDWFLNGTGWQIQCVQGLIPVDEFFELLSEKKFPSSTWLRSLDKLDYLEEPDMFHDVFGHIPLLCQPEYSDFVHKFGQLGKEIINDEEKLIMLQRLYWFTIEFGLIKETSGLRIYGAGILSSFGESISSLQKEAEKLPFDAGTILNTSFYTYDIQQKYFIIDNLNQLNESLEKIRQDFLR